MRGKTEIQLAMVGWVGLLYMAHGPLHEIFVEIVSWYLMANLEANLGPPALVLIRTKKVKSESGQNGKTREEPNNFQNQTENHEIRTKFVEK